MELRKIAFQYITAYEEKSNHHCELLDNIKKSLVNKMNFTDSFKQTDSIFEKSANEEITRMRETNQKDKQNLSRKKTMQSDKTIKTLNEKVEEMNQFYEKLEETVKGNDLDFVKTEEFQRFKAMNEKNMELKVNNSFLFAKDFFLFNLRYIFN